MPDIYDKKIQRAVLVGIDLGEYDMEVSLDELEELARTAGAEVVARLVQKRPEPDKATGIGEGKLEELKEICENNEIDLIIFDCELSPSQLKNIEDFTDIDTVDRTMLILDIFAQRALTAEGKLQVELAQQKYMLPRLMGLGKKLSRLGGGIGTRGPGESKLETDRRHIRQRIEKLKSDYKTVAKMNLIENFGYKEIADALDMPINTVKTKIRRAKAQLLKMMEYSDELL